MRGITDLDTAVPEAYDDYGINNIMIRAASFGASIGITRFFPSIVESSSAIKYGTLSKEEENIYRTVFYRRTLTKSMRNEIKRIKANAALNPWASQRFPCCSSFPMGKKQAGIRENG